MGIFFRQGESKEWDMKKAKVHSVLGQLSIVEGKNESAIGEYLAAVEIHKKYLDPSDQFSERELANAYYEVGLAYRAGDDYLKAGEFFEKAKNILTSCLETVKASGNADEIKELEQIILDVAGYVDDAQTSYKDSQLKKAMEAKEQKQATPEKAKSDDENREPAHDITIRKATKRPADDIHEDPKKPKFEEPTSDVVTEAAEVAAEPVA